MAYPECGSDAPPQAVPVLRIITVSPLEGSCGQTEEVWPRLSVLLVKVGSADQGTIPSNVILSFWGEPILLSWIRDYHCIRWRANRTRKSKVRYKWGRGDILNSYEPFHTTYLCPDGQPGTISRTRRASGMPDGAPQGRVRSWWGMRGRTCVADNPNHQLPGQHCDTRTNIPDTVLLRLLQFIVLFWCVLHLGFQTVLHGIWGCRFSGNLQLENKYAFALSQGSLGSQQRQT